MRFERVLATDASAAQLRHAPQHARIEYRVAAAQTSGLPDSSVDLIVVAQALHWFDLERFYAEARRVLTPAGLLAVWSYGIVHVDDDACDELVGRYYREIVGDYWPAERRHVEDGYAQLPFPFEPIEAPHFEMTARWSLDALVGYVRSWSATSAFVAARGMDPTLELQRALQRVWGAPDAARTIRWPLTVRVGRRPVAASMES